MIFVFLKVLLYLNFFRLIIFIYIYYKSKCYVFRVMKFCCGMYNDFKIYNLKGGFWIFVSLYY